MSLYSPELARQILDRLVEKPNISQCMRAVAGTSSKIMYVWCDQARRDREAGVQGSKYLIQDWPDVGESMWFDKAIKATRIMHALNLDSMEREKLGGVEEPVIENGALCYKKDPWQLATFKNSQEAEAFGFSDFPYLHSEKGERIVLTVTKQQPAALRIHGLRSLLADLWNPPERREVQTQGQSVLVIKSEPSKQTTPLLQDLNERLKRLRSEGPAVAKPNGPVEILGRPTGQREPQERVSLPSMDGDPLSPARNPRAPIESSEPPLEQPTIQPDYSKPSTKLDGQDRKNLPPGGFRVS
jgi:hypothetical protein